MKRTNPLFLALAVLLAVCPITAPMGAQEKPQVKIPQAGVPQIMTLEGMYVRAAYNNEGYAIIGYKTANMSIGEEWMLLEMGTTVREGVPNFSLITGRTSRAIQSTTFHPRRRRHAESASSANSATVRSRGIRSSSVRAAPALAACTSRCRAVSNMASTG